MVTTSYTGKSNRFQSLGSTDREAYGCELKKIKILIEKFCFYMNVNKDCSFVELKTLTILVAEDTKYKYQDR